MRWERNKWHTKLDDGKSSSRSVNGINRGRWSSGGGEGGKKEEERVSILVTKEVKSTNPQEQQSAQNVGLKEGSVGWWIPVLNGRKNRGGGFHHPPPSPLVPPIIWRRTRSQEWAEKKERPNNSTIKPTSAVFEEKMGEGEPAAKRTP